MQVTLSFVELFCGQEWATSCRTNVVWKKTCSIFQSVAKISDTEVLRLKGANSTRNSTKPAEQMVRSAKWGHRG